MELLKTQCHWCGKRATFIVLAQTPEGSCNECLVGAVEAALSTTRVSVEIYEARRWEDAQRVTAGLKRRLSPRKR